MSDSNRVVTLSRFQADLSRSLAKRGQRMLERDDLAHVVPDLEPLEAYLIVKELGVEEAAPILRHCSAEQWQTFVDLDCWDANELDPTELDVWLSPFWAEGPIALAEAFAKLDEEIQIWFLGASIDIFEAHMKDHLPDPPKDSPRKMTPDTYFLVQRKAGLVRELDPLVLVDSIYELELQEGFRLLTAAGWETEAPLMERALEVRTGRLESLGFPGHDRALAIFGTPAREPREVYVPKTRLYGDLPAQYAAPMGAASLLSKALAAIRDEMQLVGLEETLRNLINHAMVAYGGGPRELRHAAEIATRVRDTVSLGLESLLSPNEPLPDYEADELGVRAADLLAHWTLFELFRHGHKLVTELRQGALAIADEPLLKPWLETPQSDEEDYGDDRLDLEFFRALITSPPLYSGWDRLAPANKRAFATKSEVLDAEHRIDAIKERLT